MTTLAPGSFSAQRFHTDDPDEGHHHLASMFEVMDLAFTIHDHGDDFRFTLETVLVGATVISHQQHSMAVGATAPEGLVAQTFFISRRPALEVAVNHDQHRIGPSDAMSLAPWTPYAVTWPSSDADLVVLDQAVLDDLASAQLAPGQSLHFDFDRAISPVAADHWRRTVDLTRQIALANAKNPNGVLLADQLNRLLASAALTCFPNPTLNDTSTPRAATPASLRRATAYIDDHLDQPVTLTDIAEAAGITARSLNETFRRHLGTTPMAYLRRGRLDGARRDLQAARPGDGQTVTGIAARWGFHSLPRFGVTYRETYATTPSRTLRQPSPGGA